jgi:hypothetical protein
VPTAKLILSRKSARSAMKKLLVLYPQISPLKTNTGNTEGNSSGKNEKLPLNIFMSNNKFNM